MRLTLTGWTQWRPVYYITAVAVQSLPLIVINKYNDAFFLLSPLNERESMRGKERERGRKLKVKERNLPSPLVCVPLKSVTCSKDTDI